MDENEVPKVSQPGPSPPGPLCSPRPFLTGLATNIKATLSLPTYTCYREYIAKLKWKEEAAIDNCPIN